MRIGILTIVALIAAGPLAAQRLVTQPLDSAALVRLHLFRGGSEVGRLVAPFGPDSTMFRYAPYTSQIANRRAERPAADVSSVDVAVGTHAGSGFKTGAILCGIPGVLLSAFAVSMTEDRDMTWPAAIGLTIAGGVVAGGTCGLLGAWMGSGNPRWGPAP